MELIGYLSNGYPSFEENLATLGLYREGGMDRVQIDFPASDPYLEGAHIAERMRLALEQCSDFSLYMANIAALRRSLPDINFILLVYENTVAEIGLDRFIRFCIDQEIFDITFIGEKRPEIRGALMAAGIRLSCYVQFHLDSVEVRNAETSNGFIYLQAKPQMNPLMLPRRTLSECIAYLRDRVGPERKIYTGVGLRTPEDVIEARLAGSDGVFVGSSIIKHEAHHDRLLETIKIFKKASIEESVS